MIVRSSAELINSLCVMGLVLPRVRMLKSRV